MSVPGLSNKGVAGLFRSGCLSKEGRLRDQRGSIRLKTVFWIFFWAALLYGAYKFVPPYVSFYMIKTDVEEQTKIAHMYDDAALAARITKNAQSWAVPLAKDEVEVVRDRYNITITVRYTDTIVFFGRTVKEIPREITVQRPLKDSSGVLQ